MPVRRLVPKHVDLLRSLRLSALADAPDAFGSTYQREVAFTDEVWAARLQPGANPHFVDETDDGAALGLVAAIREDGDPAVVDLVAMWVVPEARGTGSADRLVQQVITWTATELARVVRLHVMENNPRAERLYERHGFRRTGHAVVRASDEVAQIEMERPLP